jgi:hypothetical protein
MQQFSLELIHHTDGNVDIAQRAADGYINATSLCKAAGKKWNDYLRLDNTAEFLEELEADTGIPASVLVQSVKGGIIQGTWVHPQVAVNLGQWLSAKFAVKVSKWVADWVSGNKAPSMAPTAIPDHLVRYLMNVGKVPPGHFSILQQTALDLVGPMHMAGYSMDKSWMPDISVGKAFCKFLRKDHGMDTDALPVYNHSFTDGRPDVQAKLYPEALWPMFKEWFRKVWLPEYGVAYCTKKDKASLAFLQQVPGLAAPTAPVKKVMPWHCPVLANG